MTTPEKRNPAGGRGRFKHHSRRDWRGDCNNLRALYGSSNRLPDNWRGRLDPASYYPRYVQKLTKPNAQGWAQGVCPFHEDRTASMSVQLVGSRGCWRCFAGCGAGDLVGFEQKRTGAGFKEAVAALLRERA